jgi:RNA polymerase sigma-70 factor (ECF subfamily)
MANMTTDAQIVGAVVGGRRDAFDDIVSRYRHAVRSAARAFAPNDPELVDEVEQRTFVKAYRKLDQYDRGGSMAPWLRSIARRETLQLYRSETRERERRRRWREAARLRIADMQAARSADLQALSNVMEQLSPDAARLVRLYYVEDRTALEIAEMLGRSPGGVRVSLLKIRRRLRRLLEGRLAAAS